MKRIVTLLVALLLIVSMLTACAESVENAENAENLDDFKLAFYAPVVHPFFTGIADALQDYCNDAGISSPEVVYGGDDLQTTENEKIEALAANGYRNFIIFPMDPAGANVLFSELVNAGNNVTIFDATVQLPTPASFFLGCDHATKYTDQMEDAIQAIGGKGNVLYILESLDNSNIQLAKEKYDEVLTKYPEINVLPEVADMNTVEDSAVKIDNALSSSFNEIDAIVIAGGAPSIAIPSVLEDYYAMGGRKIYVSAIDAEPETVQGVRDGLIDISWVQNSYAIGYLSGLFQEYLYRGYTPNPEAYNVDVGCVTLTKDNVDTYTDDQMNRVQEIKDQIDTHYFLAE